MNSHTLNLKKKKKDEGASYPEALTEVMRGNGKEIKAQLYLAKSWGYCVVL